jgi:hypothetical protein
LGSCAEFYTGLFHRETWKILFSITNKHVSAVIHTKQYCFILNWFVW